MIELLVVVSIIAMLVAILLPALSSARQAARMAVCASQTRQIGFMMEYYRADYKNYYPPATWPTTVVTQLRYWPQLMVPYSNIQLGWQNSSGVGSQGWGSNGIRHTFFNDTPSAKLWSCPDSLEGAQLMSGGAAQTATWAPVVGRPLGLLTQVSYGYNYVGVGPVAGVNATSAARGWNALLNELPSPPSSTFLLGDSDNVTLAGDGYYLLHPNTAYSYGRHMNRQVANIMYADGHVKGHAEEELQVAVQAKDVMDKLWFGRNAGWFVP